MTAAFRTPIIAGALLAAGLWPAVSDGAASMRLTAENLAPDMATAWVTGRLDGDDFLPPESGPGPVVSDKAHPYIPNGRGQAPTYRVADLSNPILKPSAVAEMKKANDAVLAGKVPFIARERCWPTGMPGFLVGARIVPVYFLHTPRQIMLIIALDAQVRHIYLNVPHSRNPKPSWYGESVGHYEGDTLIVDTIGMNDKTFVDNYRTPHTTALHVVERFTLTEGGNTLEVQVRVEDPGAFNMPWSAVQRYHKVKRPALSEDRCAENNSNYLNEEVRPIPTAAKPDF